MVVAALLASLNAHAGSFSLRQVLSYPFPSELTASRNGSALAYEIDRDGVRSIWFARAPGYVPREVYESHGDDGEAIGGLELSSDAGYLVYVRGESEDPTASTREPQREVWSVDLATGASKLLGDGSEPAISPDGTRVAFVERGAVWSAPVDGSQPATQLFYDAGSDADLQWSPDGSALAFVSDRGDHSLIGVYRDNSSTLQFLAPSVRDDLEPRWSPDGTRVAFARTPGDGGAPQNPLSPAIVPWSIWVVRVADGSARAVWTSPHTPRASFPTEGGDVHLGWVADDRIAFVCEMDNWPHLYVVGARGGRARLLTPGAYEIHEPAVSTDGRAIYYEANAATTPDDVDRSHLYRVDVESGRIVTVTHGAGSEWSAQPLAGGALAYVRATAQQPPLVTLASPKTRPRALDAGLVPADFPTSELTIPREVLYRAPDGTLIHAQLFMPAGSNRRPAIVFVHGGPMRQMLLTWNPMDYYDNGYAVDQYLVSRGFAVLSVNYRSGTGYGHDFHYALHIAWTGAAEYQDVLAGARWLQRQRFIEPKGIGIWGGSWGGYLTALALARNSDVFKAGVDFSGVHDLMHDAVEYFGDHEEALGVDMKPWLALAWRSSPDSSVAKWKSPILLIQGDSDPDVSFHQLVDLVPRLEAYHVPYSLIVLPDEGHGFFRYASWLRADAATVEFLEEKL
jgi:dipeptidyl aminopeptidase/acylaminoacyl peptidase